MLRRKLLALLATVTLAITASALHAADEIKATQLKPGVFLFQGAGSNVVAMNGPDGALVIDGGLQQNSAALYDAIKKATGAQKINTLFVTHWHPEQVGLNERARSDGATVIAHAQTLTFLKHKVDSPLVKGGSFGPLPASALPNQTFRKDGSLDFAGQKVEYGYLPAAHTNGDIYVFFPALNLLVGGGVVTTENWPVLDYRNGGIYIGIVKAYEKMAGIVNNDTVVVPGLGRTETGADLVKQRDMYQRLFLDLNFMMNKGIGFNDAVAENPLQGHESQYGDPSAFLDSAYRSLEMAYVPD
ncbi:MAG TPA: MBL fold metallo-hydrolase [Candidatus Acidoferrum sp.]|nr:MBL fold metallo-hydrolase [Candidatus Acidoferrum sp.]